MSSSMSSSEVNAEFILGALLQDPENDELLDQTKDLISTDLKSFGHAVRALAPPEDFAKQAAKPPARGWCNCIQKQCCDPVAILQPKNLQDLINAVKQGQENKLNVRAVGAGHSFSNVAPTNGILLNPKGMNKVLPVDVASLRDPALGPSLFSAESGITIKDLNTALDDAHLALINMGAYDGQTLAGAISTGTHGKGIKLGPIASNVCSLTLVSETGKVYQIEPANGISDPTKFAAAHPDIELKQNDDWFHSVVISMGCMGLIYSYTIEVIQPYYLKENRTINTWEIIKPQLVMQPDGSFPALLTEYRHFEIDINPYAIGGVHACIVQTTQCVKATKRSGSRGFGTWLGGLLAHFPLAESLLVLWLNRFPALSPNIILKALESLVDKNYINKSFEVLSLGPVNNVKAFAIELSLPVDETLPTNIDTLLGIFANEAKNRKWYLAGPVALRFVADSHAYLAPMQGRVTCMVEMDMLKGINNAEDLLKTVKAQMAAQNPRLRVHWGLDLDTVHREEVEKTYDMFPKWLSVYRELNSSGIWDSVFTERLDISMGGKH